MTDDANIYEFATPEAPRAPEFVSDLDAIRVVDATATAITKMREDYLDSNDGVAA